jgi:hypothetical protein
MQVNRDRFGNNKLKDFMWLPGTHDSGMDHLSSWKSTLASEGNTLTQTYGIGDQLLLGVRWFDLRPMWLDDKWVIAHAGAAGALGWQGASGPHLREVIKEVNEFTSSHAELIVLRVTHITEAKTGAAVHGRFPDLIQQLFSKINHVYLGANGQSESDLYNKTLNDFIGNGKAKVIITTEPKDGPGLHDTRDLQSVPAHVTNFDISKISLTAALGGIDNVIKDIRNESAKLQDREWIKQPQRLWNSPPSGGCAVFEIDNVYNMALVTVCLAASHARLMFNVRRQYGDVVIVYGGRLIEDPYVKANVLQAARSRSSFWITNESMGVANNDPWHGERKCCAVFVVAGGGFACAKFEWEGKSLDFNNGVGLIDIH